MTTTSAYTATDLRDAAAHWLRLVVGDNDFADYGQPLLDQTIHSTAPSPNPTTWGALLDTDENAYDTAETQILDLMRKAPTLDRYGIELGAENLTPAQHTVIRDQDGTALAAVHLATSTRITDPAALLATVTAAVHAALDDLH